MTLLFFLHETHIASYQHSYTLMLKNFEKENFHLFEILDASFSIKDAKLRICHLSAF